MTKIRCVLLLLLAVSGCADRIRTAAQAVTVAALAGQQAREVLVATSRLRERELVDRDLAAGHPREVVREHLRVYRLDVDLAREALRAYDEAVVAASREVDTAAALGDPQRASLAAVVVALVSAAQRVARALAAAGVEGAVPALVAILTGGS